MIWYDNYDITEGLGIKCINSNKVLGYELENQALIKLITVFPPQMWRSSMLAYIGL